MLSKFNKLKLTDKLSLIGISLSLLGIADSIYLTIAHLTSPAVLACPENSFINCSKVTTSPYSVLFGIPIVYLGLLFFISMLVLQLPRFWDNQNKWFNIVRLSLSTIGLFMVFYLVYAELDLINAICIFCTGVHILTVGLFINNLIGFSLTKKKSTNRPANQH